MLLKQSPKQLCRFYVFRYMVLLSQFSSSLKEEVLIKREMSLLVSALITGSFVHYYYMRLQLVTGDSQHSLDMLIDSYCSFNVCEFYLLTNFCLRNLYCGNNIRINLDVGMWVYWRNFLILGGTSGHR